MAEVLTEHAGPQTERGSELAKTSVSSTRSSLFQYYIHDSVAALRFQLIGDLHRSNIRELNGSWETAKTTLAQRHLVLDLSKLQSADEDGKTWLRKMKDAGAETLPAEYWASTSLSSRTTAGDKPVNRPGLFDKMRGVLRSVSSATKCH